MLNMPLLTEDVRALPVLQLCRLAAVEDWHMSDMSLPQWRLLCPLDEGASVCWQGVHHPLRPAHAYLLAPQTPSRSSSQGRFRLAYAHLHWPLRARVPRPGLHEHRLSPALARDLRGLEVSRSGLGLLLQHCALEALRALDASAFTETAVFSPLVAAALERIHADPGNCPDNDTLAAGCYVSSATLNRHFIAELGTSVRRYVMQQRLIVARTLLLESDDSIEAIAEHCGFADRHHFSRAFKQAWGVPPARLRRRSRNQE